jgi:hypothetical protein
VVLAVFICFPDRLLAHPSEVNLVTIDISNDSLGNRFMFKLNKQDFLLVFPDSSILGSTAPFSELPVKNYEEYLSSHFVLTFNEKNNQAIKFVISEVRVDQKFIFLYGSFKKNRKTNNISMHNTIFFDENEATITLLIFTFGTFQQGYKFDINNPEVLINLDNEKENQQ